MTEATQQTQSPLRDATDVELTGLAVKQGRAEAFGELVRRHQGKIRALLMRLTRGNRTLTDDLTQEAFLRAYRGLPGFEGRSRFSTWVHRIAYFVYLNHRNRVRQPAALPDEFELTTPAPEDELSPRRADMRRDLALLVDGLPAHYRQVIVMHFVRHVPYRDIADTLDLPLGTVKTQLHRAKLLMREQLVELGDAPMARAAA